MGDKQYISNQEIVIPDIVVQILATKILDYQKFRGEKDNVDFQYSRLIKERRREVERTTNF